MKRLLSITIALFTTVFSLAQENKIIFTDFEPDLSIEALTATDFGDTVKVDLDQDGTIDFNMYIGVMNSTMVRYVFVSSSWYFRCCANSIYTYGYTDEYDTLVPEPHHPAIWGTPGTFWELLWEPDTTHFMEFYMGFRKVVNDDNYYAWARIYMYRNLNGQGHHPQHGDFDIVSAYFDQMAYCTLPNYPLRWGQISTDVTDVFENTAFATLHPNPTSDVITVSGQDLKNGEVFNALGQRIASVKSIDHQLTIDLICQPAGIYFVNVTDSAGRKCVKKVVKY